MKQMQQWHCKLKRRCMALILLANFVFVLAVGACKNEQKTSAVAVTDPSKPGYTLDTSPITLDWYIHFDWFNFEFGKDLVSQEIVKNTGVSINYVKPAGSPAEKLNTMMASDSLPDLITLGWWEGQIPQMIEAKMVWPLDELAKKYDPYFIKVANPQRLAWYRQEDGHTYGYPNASYTPSDLAGSERISGNFTFEVRKDIWEAIGQPEMRTPEDFIAALRAAKEQYPKIDGQPLIPLGLHEFMGTGSLSLTEMLPDFLAIPREKEGNFYDRFADPEYKRWLAVLNQAYREGLLSDDVFMDKRAQMEEKIAQGRYFAMLYQRTDFIRPQAELYKEDPNKIYIAIDGPANRNLDEPTISGPGINGWCLTLVSRKSKHPDRAIRLMTYLMSPEGQKLLYLGVKNVTWDTIDGRDQLLPEMKQMFSTDRSSFDTQYGALFNHWPLMDNPYALSRWEDPPESPVKELTEWGYGKAVSTSVYADTRPTPGTKLERNASQMDLAFAKGLSRLLRAASDDEFARIWDEIQAERKEKGLDELLEFKTQRMMENKQKLSS
ncbi:MAG: extracellular solute-binding protein [Spirochaetota bacterium]